MKRKKQPGTNIIENNNNVNFYILQMEKNRIILILKSATEQLNIAANIAI